MIFMLTIIFRNFELRNVGQVEISRHIVSSLEKSLVPLSIKSLVGVSTPIGRVFFLLRPLLLLLCCCASLFFCAILFLVRFNCDKMKWPLYLFHFVAIAALPDVIRIGTHLNQFNRTCKYGSNVLIFFSCIENECIASFFFFFIHFCLNCSLY